MDDTSELPWEINEDNFPGYGTPENKLRFLLRYAILAPSNRNTQPWKFRVEGPHAEIFIDRSCWLKVADAGQRELNISIGCALENLLTAIRHFGHGYHVNYLPDPNVPDLAVRVRLTTTPITVPWIDEGLFHALSQRQSNHYGYKPEAINQATQQGLRDCCVEPELSLFMTEVPAIKDEIDRLSVEANAIQFADPAFMEEFRWDSPEMGYGMPWLLAKTAWRSPT